MSDRRSFLARLTGALAGMVASKHVAVEAAPPPNIPMKSMATEAPDFYTTDYTEPAAADVTTGDGRRVRPKRAIRVVNRNEPSKLNVLWDEFDVYVDGVLASDVLKVDYEYDWTVAWIDVTVYTRIPIKGIEPDSTAATVVPVWIEYVYRGYRA